MRAHEENYRQDGGLCQVFLLQNLTILSMRMTLCPHGIAAATSGPARVSVWQALPIFASLVLIAPSLAAFALD
jgi:hypothetical protein